MAWIYPRVIAHRCGGALGPENTLAGLRIAARLGCRAVEFDAMLAADGVPVLIHDDTVDRTTDGAGRVAARTALDLAGLDAGIRHHRAFAGEPVPTLASALELCAHLGLAANVEIKPAAGSEVVTGEAVTAVVEAARLRFPGMPLLLSSFSRLALAASLRTVPALERALLVEEIPEDWRGLIEAQGCIAIHAAGQLLDESLLAAIAGRGVPVACYTVNRPDLAAHLFGRGVSAVFTDRPDLFPAEH